MITSIQYRKKLPPSCTLLTYPKELIVSIQLEKIKMRILRHLYFSADSTMPNFYNPSPSVLPPWNDKSEYLNYCTPKHMRTIYWNWTRIMETNIQPCPGGTTGYAKWRCIDAENGPSWYPDTPDLSACRSVWLTSLEQRIQNANGKDPLLAITNDLAQVTSSKTLYGGDMMITTKIIKTLTHKMSNDIQTFADHTQRETFVTEMLNHVVKTSSNLLDVSQHPSWTDLSYEEQMRVATSLLIGLEENAFLLANTIGTMSGNKSFDQEVKNISMLFFPQLLYVQAHYYLCF